MEFDAALNDGEGGIISGNGRLEALFQLKAEGAKCPKYVIEDGDEWLVPIVFGADSDSQAAAEAYGIDANGTLVKPLSGEESIKIWHKEGYLSLLKELIDQRSKPVTISLEDAQRWIAESAPITQEVPDPERMDKNLRKKRDPVVKLVLFTEDLTVLEEAIAKTGKVNDWAEAIREILHHYLDSGGPGKQKQTAAAAATATVPAAKTSNEAVGNNKWLNIAGSKSR
ncbi:MAG TPA: hypothetical protein V6D07_19130 [Trichocoleus sp.]